ncbi:MAG: hypothetical protein IJK63_01325 [Oscillospiraceae bacterium]|nr:hypothetical protein [Oscillospiraceae bacterium]
MYKNLIRKMFAVDTYFTIALKRREGNVLNRPHSSTYHPLPANRLEWCADPFLVQERTHTYLFYEKVNLDKGSIEVAEICGDGTLSAPSVLFGGDSHYSYPYVFRKGSQWCMIPESSSLGEVSLYTAAAFPFQWEKQTVLLQEAAVDTTVFEWKNQWYLLTFLPLPNTERVTARAYRLIGSQLSPLVWDDYDQLCVRGAGCPFRYKGELIRPVQGSTDLRYGDRVAFVKIEIDGNAYHETVLDTLECSEIKASGQFFDGLHTYNSCDTYEAIDLRCGKLSWSKPIHRMLRLFSGRHANNDHEKTTV